MAPEQAEGPSIFRFRDIDAQGLSRGRLRAMVASGEIERLGRGLYRRQSEATELETVATVCARVPRAVVCLLSALAMHGIGTQLPHQVWIAIDRKARKPRLADLPVRILRFSPSMLRYGIEERTVQGVHVRVTSPARTVVDCFRYRHKVGVDVALEALKESLRMRRVTVNQLVRVGQVGRVDRVMSPYLEAVLA